jgi:hypothetical protein
MRLRLKHGVEIIIIQGIKYIIWSISFKTNIFIYPVLNESINLK